MRTSSLACACLGISLLGTVPSGAENGNPSMGSHPGHHPQLPRAESPSPHSQEPLVGGLSSWFYGSKSEHRQLHYADFRQIDSSSTRLGQAEAYWLAVSDQALPLGFDFADSLEIRREVEVSRRTLVILQIQADKEQKVGGLEWRITGRLFDPKIETFENLPRDVFEIEPAGEFIADSWIRGRIDVAPMHRTGGPSWAMTLGVALTHRRKLETVNGLSVLSRVDGSNLRKAIINRGLLRRMSNDEYQLVVSDQSLPLRIDLSDPWETVQDVRWWESTLIAFRIRKSLDTDSRSKWSVTARVFESQLGSFASIPRRAFEVYLEEDQTSEGHLRGQIRTVSKVQVGEPVWWLALRFNLTFRKE